MTIWGSTPINWPLLIRGWHGYPMVDIFSASLKVISHEPKFLNKICTHAWHLRASDSVAWTNELLVIPPVFGEASTKAHEYKRRWIFWHPLFHILIKPLALVNGVRYRFWGGCIRGQEARIHRRQFRHLRSEEGSQQSQGLSMTRWQCEAISR